MIDVGGGGGATEDNAKGGGSSSDTWGGWFQNDLSITLARVQNVQFLKPVTGDTGVGWLNSPLVSWDLMGSQHFSFESGAVIVVTFCLKSEGTPCQRTNEGRPGGALILAGTPPSSGARRRSLGR